MKESTRINHVGLRVRDLAVTREFYEKLGFEFLVGPVGPEPVAIMEHPSGVNINFILNASPDASPTNLLMDEATKHTGYTHIALEISDAESLERQLDAAGITHAHGAAKRAASKRFLLHRPHFNRTGIVGSQRPLLILLSTLLKSGRCCTEVNRQT